jgi:hypothetical protein
MVKSLKNMLIGNNLLWRIAGTKRKLTQKKAEELNYLVNEANKSEDELEKQKYLIKFTKKINYLREQYWDIPRYLSSMKFN